MLHDLYRLKLRLENSGVTCLRYDRRDFIQILRCHAIGERLSMNCQTPAQRTQTLVDAKNLVTPLLKELTLKLSSVDCLRHLTDQSNSLCTEDWDEVDSVATRVTSLTDEAEGKLEKASDDLLTWRAVNSATPVSIDEVGQTYHSFHHAAVSLSQDIVLGLVKACVERDVQMLRTVYLNWLGAYATISSRLEAAIEQESAWTRAWVLQNSKSPAPAESQDSGSSSDLSPCLYDSETLPAKYRNEYSESGEPLLRNFLNDLDAHPDWSFNVNEVNRAKREGLLTDIAKFKAEGKRGAPADVYSWPEVRRMIDES